MAFTSGNDVNILQASDSSVVGAGAGNDKYILAANQLGAGQTITLSDAQGSNTLQLIGGLTITSSLVANNVAQLTLSNGAVVNINGANNFSYEIGGDPLTGVAGVVQNYSTFATTTLGAASVPPAGSAPVPGTPNTTINPTPASAYTLTASPTFVAEGSTATFTLTAATAPTTDQVFHLTFAGDTNSGTVTAATAADLTSVPTTVTLLAGQTTTTFSVQPTINDGNESLEGFKFNVLDPSGAPVGTGTPVVMISNVPDADTTKPVVAPAQSFSNPENQAAGFTLGTVAATDNVGLNSFAIATGNDNNYFAINNLGQITLTAAGASLTAASNDFETLPNAFSLGVTATDAAGNTSDPVNVTLNVTNVDDTPPTFDTATRSATSITLTFNENLDSASVPSPADFVVKKGTTSIAVTSVGLVAGGGKTVTLSLATALADADAVSVVYTKPGINPLQDAAGNDVLNFTVSSVTKDVTPPTVAAQTFSYQEGAPTTTSSVVATVVAGGGDVASFAITTGNGNGFFAINNSGQITLTTVGLASTAASNDFETTPNTFALGVTATDNAGNVSTAGTITLNVTDNPADNLAAPIIASLTTGADPAAGVVLGSNNDDIISGLVSAAAGETTFSSADFINTGDNGSAGDTLNIELRGASYTGGATIQNVENLKVTTGTAQNFNSNGMTSVNKIINNASAAALTVQNMHAGMLNFELNNIAGGVSAGVYQYAAGQLTGSQVAKVVLTGPVGATGANSAFTIGPVVAVANSLAEIDFEAKSGAGFVTLTTDAVQTSLKTIQVTGTNAFTLALAADQVATTATTINAGGNSGGFTLTGLGAAAHTVTGGSGSDLFAFGANLGATDAITGGDGTDTLSANGAQLAAVTAAVKPTVTTVETLMIADDVGAVATTVDASLFGGSVSNARVADQGAAGVAAITFNGLKAAASGSSNNIRLDGDVGATGGTLTFNILNAQDAGTANAVTLDLRGGATTATSAVVLNGVETLTVDTTNGTGAKTFNITDAALQSLTVMGGQNVTINGANLGAGVTTINATGMTGAAALTATLNPAATSGAAVTTAGGADVIVGSQLNDTISTAGGADDITGLGGADKLNGGTGNDTFRYTAANQTGVATFGTGSTSTATLDVLTVNAGDQISLAGAMTTAANYDFLGTLQVAGNLSNTTTTTTVQRVLGVYDATAGTFTVGVTGANAVMLNWANNDDTSSDESIILVGVNDVTSVTDGVLTV
ncbi:MAG: hypothetical protein J5X22_02630 [Candidatus Accumulibacter sp.]|uniref:Alkaline phosphatase n=1 Tax=Candidatus Accumulibacter phosphatis TaxID=327160 RepID=A0A5S4EKY7_9PROT|nr:MULTISPECIES: SwmB domain-containing protein [Candidatus Accumulibacter]MBN8517958.1 hypothetical protein [Accumulibacter sp.]MBO3709437.1 hypothetical protein [Accumulibacter sp.]TMQ76024.1 Alkaline phosphatase [Candidatus Accumulibacter phosphatis]